MRVVSCTGVDGWAPDTGDEGGLLTLVMRVVSCTGVDGWAPDTGDEGGLLTLVMRVGYALVMRVVSCHW